MLDGVDGLLARVDRPRLARARRTRAPTFARSRRSRTIFCDDATLEILSGLDRRRFDRHWTETHTPGTSSTTRRMPSGVAYVATWQRKLVGHEGAGQVVFHAADNPVDESSGVTVMRVVPDANRRAVGRASTLSSAADSTFSSDGSIRPGCGLASRSDGHFASSAAKEVARAQEAPGRRHRRRSSSRSSGRMLLHAALVGAAAGLLGSLFFAGVEVAQRVVPRSR